MEYIGEHLLPGQIGNFFIVLSCITALLACVCYWFATVQPNDTSWRTIARIAYLTHVVSVVSIGATLFYILFNNMFEYHYAWQHSSKALPMYYIFSCFWEGQEGSTWLWMFWIAILGLIVFLKKSTWETSVMTSITSIQAFLGAMLLGVIIFDYRMGSNPFTLLREHPDMAQMPFLKISNYLQSIDGRGLNPLLQNYWMTIHPPTLFLGFASTVIPFAYAIAALWQRRYAEWIKPVLPWAIFSVAILGTGILMGGAWAYESLSFGGFWAWDPVENASLVPWIIMVAAMHVILIYKHNNASVFSALLLTILSFLLIVYSTFLTKSGILGNSSVHAFTDMGMSGLLLVFLLFYLVGSIVLMAVRYKDLPSQKTEDELWSREFWMFIGTLILVIASFQILFTTSLPVVNKVFGTNYAPPTNVIEYYNSWQTPFAIIIALLMAVTQFLRWKKADIKQVAKSLTYSALATVVIGSLLCILLKINTVSMISLCIASIFTVCANADYWLRILSGKINKAGSSIAHIGFGLILLGTLISQFKQTIISRNVGQTDISRLDKDMKNNENVLLNKGDTTLLGNYYVVYHTKRKEGVNIYYDMDYLQRNPNGSYRKEFTLSPIIQTNARMGNIAEPDTRHFLGKDVYTHITYADLSKDVGDKNDHDFRETLKKGIHTGDTIFAQNAMLILEGLIREVDKTKLQLQATDIALAARFTVLDINKQARTIEPLYVIRDNYLVPIEADVKDLGLRVTFKELNTTNGTIDIVLAEDNNLQKEFIVMKAIVFPGINVLWIGALIMVIGSAIAMWQRIKALKIKLV
jgi:cytochrome c-type biogenesis protein CcmF